MFEDRVIAAAPGGSFFSTGGVRGLITNTPSSLGISNDFTFSVWVRVSNLPASGVVQDIIRATPTNSDVNGQIALQVITDGTNSFFRSEVSTFSGGIFSRQQSKTAIIAGRWYNLVFLKFGTFVLRFFINGVEDSDLITTGVPFANILFRTLSVGYDSRDINPNFDGDIDSVALWSIALSEESIRASYNNGWRNLDLRVNHPCYDGANSLVHWWRFGQGAQASSVGDDFVSDWGLSSGIPLVSSLSAITENDILVPKFPQSSAIGNSLLFNEQGFIRNPVPLLLGIGNRFTLSFWLNVREVLAEPNTIFYMGPEAPSTLNSVTVSIDGAQVGNPIEVIVRSNTGSIMSRASFANTVIVGEWAHFTLTFDSSVFPKVALYKDAEFSPISVSIDSAGNRNNSGVFMEIGGSTKKVNPETNFKGQIGHVGLWDKVLSLEEIAFLYSQGYFADLRYNNTSYQSAENLKRYYKLGEDVFVKGRDFLDTMRGDSVALSEESGEAGSVVVVGNSPFQEGSEAQPLPPPAGIGRSVEIMSEGNILDGVDGKAFRVLTPTQWSMSQNWSISFWFKKAAFGGDLFRLDPQPFNESGDTNKIQVTQPFNGSLAVVIKDKDGFNILTTNTSADTIDLNVWSHICIVRDASGPAVVYLDSIPVLTDTVMGLIMEDILRAMTYGNSFNATDIAASQKMGHLAMWDSPLSVSEVFTIFSKGHSIDLRQNLENYTSSADLVHYYRPGFVDEGFTDEGVKAVPRVDIEDSVNIDETDIVDDAPMLFTPLGPEGSISKAPPGSIKLLASTTPSPVSIASTWSISFWYKPLFPEPNTGTVFTLKQNVSNLGFNGILISNQSSTVNKGLSININGDASQIFGSGVFDVTNDGEWNHVALIKADDSLFLYVNNILALNGVNVAGPMSDSNRIILYGADNLNNSSQYLNLGHLAMWDSSLTAQEVDTIFNGNHDIDLRQNSGNYFSSGDLVHYYRPGFNGFGIFDEGVKAVPKINLVNSLGLNSSDIIKDSPPLPGGIFRSTQFLDITTPRQGYLNNTLNPLGIANDWTISFWAKSSKVTSSIIFKASFGNASTTFLDNEISILSNNTGGITFIVRQPSGDEMFRATANDLFPLDSWRMVSIVRDGNAQTFQIYADGQPVSDLTIDVDIPQIMTDTPRKLSYENGIDINDPFSGNLGHLSIWNTPVSQDALLLLKDKGHSIDLRSNQGVYTFASNLVHYYRPGFIDEGFTDEGVTSDMRIDFVDSLNIDITRVTQDAPPFT